MGNEIDLLVNYPKVIGMLKIARPVKLMKTVKLPADLARNSSMETAIVDTGFIAIQNSGGLLFLLDKSLEIIQF